MVDTEACGNIRVERERMMAQEKREGPKEHKWRRWPQMGTDTFHPQRNKSRMMSYRHRKPGQLSGGKRHCSDQLHPWCMNCSACEMSLKTYLRLPLHYEVHLPSHSHRSVSLLVCASWLVSQFWCPVPPTWKLFTGREHLIVISESIDEPGMHV